MKIFIYRYSIGSINLDQIDTSNWRIIAPKDLKSDYTNTLSKVQLANCSFVENFQLSTVFLEIQKMARFTEISEIVTLSETDMLWVGLLNDFYCNKNHNSNSFLVNACFKDKYYMRTILQNVIPQPFFSLVHTKNDITNFVSKNGKSLLKPRNLASAQGIKIISDSESSLDSISTDLLDSEVYIIEQYSPFKNMCTCDGFAVDGEIKYFCIHEYESGVLDSFNTRKPFIIRTSKVYSNQSLVKKLFSSTHSIITNVGSKGVFPFHFEFFYQNNEILFCEGGKRFGGQGVITLPLEEYGIDILSKYWTYQNNTAGSSSNRLLVPHKRIVAWFQMFNPGGVLTHMASLPNYQWIKAKKFFVKEGQTYNTPENASDICFSIEFTSENEHNYLKHLNKLKEFADNFRFE